MDQEGKDRQQQPSVGLWAAGIFWVALVFLLIVLGGYVQEWKWTGLPKQNLWGWLDLLIVPAVLAVGGYLLTERQRALDRELSTQQTETDRELADERRQDETLQAYLDGMAQLLTDKERPLHETRSDDSLSTVARARTLTVLGRLDGGRKRSVLRFLYEAGLIYKERTLLNEGDLIERRHTIVVLGQANLQGTNLSGVYLREANLNLANLKGIDLRGANLQKADLWLANLSEANLSGARGITTEELEQQAMSLEGATMPNGQKYEDWLKSRGEKNSGPS